MLQQVAAASAESSAKSTKINGVKGRIGVGLVFERYEFPRGETGQVISCKHRCWRVRRPRSIQLFLFWFQGGAEFGKKTKKTQKTPSAAPSASSLPELLPKIAASTITAEEAPAALFKPTPALWQGRAPSSSATAATSTPESMLSTSATCILACVIFLFSLFFCCCGKYSSVAVAPFSRLTSAFNLVCFLRHVFCLASCPNSSGLVLIRVK